MNLDTGNFHSDNIYGELEQVAAYALNVQVKVVVMGPDKKKEPADLAGWPRSCVTWAIAATSCWNTKRTKTRGKPALRSWRKCEAFA